MARQKTLSPQEIYKARREREEEERNAYLPPGLINHGNTCFMNSVLQGLIATPLLSDLAQFKPFSQKLSSTAVSPRQSPQLTNEHGFGGEYERKWVSGMPIGDVFVFIMHRAWALQRARRRESISPRALLTTLGRKYDQYLDFAQQDAHEFLRQLLDVMRMEEFDIIKARRPPTRTEKPRKHQRRHTYQSTSSSNHPNGASDGMTPDDKLMPFVDMIFGGKLTSILVCEKCKHVSQTQEDFNDLSLSIKPEDYTKERKRDLFKSFAKRLTSFPTNAFGGGVEMQRSSSVPPSPRGVNQLAELPIEDGPRRRSLDIISDTSLDDTVVVSKSELDGSGLEEAVGTPPITSDGKQHPTVIEEVKQVTEPPKVEKEKKEKDDASWSKLGRRISMSIRLGKDKERNGRPKDVNPKTASDLSANKQKETEERTILQGPFPLTSSASGSDIGHNTDPSPDLPTKGAVKLNSPFLSERAKLRVRKRDSRPKSISVIPLTQSATPPTAQASHRLPTIQQISNKRPKSPQPPKPTPEETAYLRQILADITPASSNPFGLFKNSGQHETNHVPPSTSSSSANALWLKMGQLAGIEECLRLFTAVEILDGENMVGCRRCWKIENGVYTTSPQGDGESPREDSDNDENEKGEKDDVQAGLYQPNGIGKPSPLHVPPLSAPSLPFSSLSASVSSPILSLYSHKNRSDNVSIASLPLLDTSVTAGVKKSPPSLSLRDDTSSAEFQTASSGSPTPAVSTPSPEDPSSPLTARPILFRKHSDTSQLQTAPPTYGSIPIPLISTTAPESPSSPSTARPRPEQNSRWAPPPSQDSLRTPTMLHGRPKESDFYDNSYESSETESDDASTTTSACDQSESSSPTLASPGPSRHPSQHSKESSSSASNKPVRPKHVIMRAAYKRYLIGTPPPILVIHLKRFQQIAKTHLISFTHGFKKLEDYVTFHEYLDLTPFLAPKKEDFGLGKAGRKKLGRSKEKERCMYRLYAVVVHIGNMLGGHYVAYTALPTPPAAPPSRSASASTVNTETAPATANNKPSRKWAYISDTVVRLTTIEEVLKVKAYICMYERI